MLYFVRHGQTDDNKNGNLLTGWVDTPLNQTGIKQAKEAALKLKDTHIDICYCSPLSRARMTMEEIKKYHPNLNVIFDERLKERYYGELTGTPAENLPFARWDGKAKIPESMESIEHLYNRVKKFYDEILAKEKGKDVLVVAHSGVGRATYYYYNGLPEDMNFTPADIKNAEVYTYKN